MALKVPQYQEQVRTEVPQISAPRQPSVDFPNVIPAAFGADIGKATESLGKVGGQIAEHLKRVIIDEQDKEILRRETAYRKDVQDRLFNNETETKTIDGQEIERTKGLLLRQLGQAKGATQDFDEIYSTQLRNQYLGGLSEYQISKLSPAMDSYYLSSRNNVITHEANQLDEDFKQATDSNIEQSILDASTIRDGESLNKAIDENIEKATPYYSKFDEVSLKLKNEEIASTTVKSSVISTLESTGNLEIAQSLLDSAKDKISTESYRSIQEDIKKILKVNIEKADVKYLENQSIAQMKFENNLNQVSVSEALNILDNGKAAGIYNPTWADAKRKAILYTGGIDQGNVDRFESETILKITDISKRYTGTGVPKKRKKKDAKEYLKAIHNVEIEINDLKSKGLLTQETYDKLITKIFSDTTSQATEVIATKDEWRQWDSRDANDYFEKVLPLEDTYRAVREFFYEVGDKKLRTKEGKEVASKIADNIMEKNRQSIFNQRDTILDTEGEAPTFANEAEVKAANLPDNTEVIIKGKRYMWINPK